VQQDLGYFGATLVTLRRRSIVVAVLCTPAFLLIIGTDPFAYGYSLRGELTANLVELVLLVAAVKAWPIVLRRPTELRMTPDTLTVKRGDRELILPWQAVGQIYLDVKGNRPWVVVWLDPSVDPAQVPVSRRRDGSYRIFPIAHGRGIKARHAQIGLFQNAIKGFARRWVEVIA
jgi:hypothetical protein